MKFKKTIGALFAAAIVAASFAGCGETDTPGTVVSQVGQSAATMTPAEVLKAAKNASTKAESEAMQAKMTAELKMTAKAEGQTADMNMNIDADIIAKQDPMSMAMNMKMDATMAGQTESQDMSMYILEENGKYAVYMGTDGQWQKQLVEMNDPRVQQSFDASAETFDTNTFTDSFVSDAQKFKNKGIRKVNGKNAVVLEGEISAKEMSEALKSAGIEQQLAALNMTLDDIKTESGIQVTACYDAETYMPVQISIDMTDFCAEMVQSMLKNALSTASDASMDVKKYVMTIDITAYGKDVPDVVLPAAAANAATR